MSHHVEWRCALVRHLSNWRLQTYQHMRPAAFRWLQGFSELQKFLMHHWLMNSYWFTIIPALRTLKVLMTISKHLLAEAYFLALGHLQIKLYSVISAPTVQLRSSEWKQSHIVPEPQYLFSHKHQLRWPSFELLCTCLCLFPHLHAELGASERHTRDCIQFQEYPKLLQCCVYWSLTKH